MTAATFTTLPPPPPAPTTASVSLIHTSGGLLGDVFTDALRQTEPTAITQVLAKPGTFTDPFGQPPTVTQYQTDLDAAFRASVALFTSYRAEIEQGMDLPRLREKVLVPFLRTLGFDPQYQKAHLRAGDHTWAISHRGWDSPDAPPLLLITDEDLDDRGGRRRSAHEEIQGYLNNHQVRWGIVTNGRVLRLVRDYHHTRSKGYVEADLTAIFAAASEPDFLALYRLTHASRFQPVDVSGAAPPSPEETDEDAEATPAPSEDVRQTTPLELAYEQNLNAGVAAGKRLQPQVRDAIETLANGLLDATPGLRQQLLSDPDKGREFYREILTVLYRVLFLLLAEQRGMLSRASGLYQETYSVTALRGRGEADDAEHRRHDLWEGLKTTFRVFGDPSAAATVGVYPYNGQLFDLARTPLTGAGRCDNKHLLDVIRSLTSVPVGRVRMHVDYRNLGVEELGTVYESLLDYTLTVAATATASDGRVIPPGRAYLASLSTERADLASYYTPTDLVDLLLSRSLDPLIAERLAAAGAARPAREAALLSLKVIDPACGSAAILIGALDRIAAALAAARRAPHEPTDADLAHARRDVLQHCIYGVDKDPFAVELAKVALWIHCLLPDQPLSFLDSRIVCGDALVGWPLMDLPPSIPTEAFEYAKARKEDKKVLAAARSWNALYLDQDTLFSVPTVNPDLQLPADLAKPDTSAADVRHKAAAYRTWKDSHDYRRWKAAADLWTAAFFWTADHGDAPTTQDYQQAVTGQPGPDLADHAAAVLADLNPLHWPLAFPDVRAAGGFDIVLGNPPWEQYKGEEQAFFAQAAPHIAAMTSEHRGLAIEDLAEANPGLHHRWLNYLEAQRRLSHFAKVSGRYTRTPNEANTYVLFTEAAAAASSHAGLIVKTGIATDNAQSRVWRSLLDAGRVVEIRDMVNSGPRGGLVFPAVAAVERFCTLVLGPPRPDRTLAAAMMNFGTAEAALATPVAWTRADLRSVAPATHTLLSTASMAEIDLAVRLQKLHPALDFSEPDSTNPWGMATHALFHSSGMKRDGLVHRREALEAAGYTLGADKVFRHPDNPTMVPVYEGQMANRWDHRARTYEGYTGANKYGRKPHIPWTTEAQHEDPAFEVEPRYWMDTQVAATRIKAVAGDRWLLAYRDVGRPYSDRRIMRACLFPRLPATHKLPVISVDAAQAFGLLAVLNSVTFDFLARVHMPGGSLMPWVISQCAVPPPDTIDGATRALASALSVTSNGLAQMTGQPVTTWDSADREAIDAELDARIAAAYGLTRDDYVIVLDHFQLLRRIEEKQLGEYKSKRLRLAAFEQIGGGT